ncbi:MAG: class I SAM-dependent methyltransferase [Bacteroidota bacterium]
MTDKKEWFNDWFDSPYYHVLYKNHDATEARHFIDNFISVFELQTDLKVMDLACGRGRHAAYLNSLGYDVTGIDLSKQNIEYARQFENDKLRFIRHDMRDVFPVKEFDIIVNVFTSFGYFQTTRENWKAVLQVKNALTTGGMFLLDFFNPNKVIEQLVPYQEKIVDGILFKINKEIKSDNCIIKDIKFESKGKDFHFKERVRLITKDQFETAFKKLGFTIKGIYGDYNFNSYDDKKSQRLIFVVMK